LIKFEEFLCLADISNGNDGTISLPYLDWTLYATNSQYPNFLQNGSRDIYLPSNFFSPGHNSQLVVT